MSPINPESPKPALPHEAQPSVERETIASMLNPASARIAAEAVKKSSLDPDAILPKNEEIENRFKQWFTHKTPDYMNFNPIEALSEDSRRAYTKEQAQKEPHKSFDERKADWNEDTSKWIKRNTKEGAANRDEVAAALKALGVGVDKDNPDQDLSAEVGGFYDKYLDGKSEVKKFVGDIAEDLKDAKGHVDLAKLQARLTAVKGLVTAFGTKDDVDKLVQDYGMAYGVLSQSEATKKEAAEAILPHSAQPVPEGPERTRLEPLNRKHQEQKLAQVAAQTQPQAESAPVPAPTPEPTGETIADGEVPTQLDEQVEAQQADHAPMSVIPAEGEQDAEDNAPPAEHTNVEPEIKDENQIDQVLVAPVREEAEENSPKEPGIEVGQRVEFMDFKGKVTEVLKNGKILAEFEGEKGTFNYEIDPSSNKLTILPESEGDKPDQT